MKQIYFSHGGFIKKSLLATILVACFAPMAAYAQFGLSPEVGTGSAVTAGQDLRSVSSFLYKNTGRQVGKSLVPGYYARSLADNSVSTGLAAGDAGQNLNLWADYSYSELDSKADAIRSDTNAHYLNIGLDTVVAENVVLGGVLSYEESHTDSDPASGVFLFGPVTTSTNMDRDAWTGTVYAGYKFAENWTVDAAYSYTPDIDIDQRTKTNVVGVGILDAASNNQRHSFSINLNRYWLADTYKVEGHVGYLYVKEDQESYLVIDRATGLPVFFLPGGQTPSDTSLGQLNFRTRVTWLMGNFEPFIGAAYEYDHNGADENIGTANAMLNPGSQLQYDKSGFVLNGGFDYYVGDSGNLNFELSTVEGRTKEDAYAVMMGYRHSF